MQKVKQKQDGCTDVGAVKHDFSFLNVSIGQLFNCRGLACLLSQQQHERCAVLCLVLTAGRNQC